MKNIKLPTWSDKFFFPAFLLGLTILTYGLLAFSLGFYLDDWYIALYQKYFGASGFIKFFEEDRPFLAYVYMLFLPIFKDSSAGWQIFAVITRWLATVSFWVLLNQLFPSLKKLWKFAAILFLVYPGFQFHWFAIMYSQVYLLMAIYFGSYLFMLKAFNQRKIGFAYIGWTLAALVSLVVGIVPMEYFYGMELFRPIVLWLLLYRESRKPVTAGGKALVQWLPYLAVFSGFTYFRISFSSAYSYQIGILDQLANNPASIVLELFSKAFWSVYDSTFTVWWTLMDLFKKDLLTTSSMIMVALVIVGSILIYSVLSKKQSTITGEHVAVRGWKITVLGLILTSVALVPFIAASFPVSLDFPANRFLLSLAPGISIFIAGAIDELLRTEKQKIALVALLGGLAIGSQFITSRSFYLLWEAQKDFFWQLTWRAPGLQPGTALVSDDVPFSKYFSGTSLTAPLNLIYSPENRSPNLENVILLMTSPQGEVIPSFEQGIDLHYGYRFLEFKGNTDALITFYKSSDGCLRLLSPEDSTEEFSHPLRYDFWHSSILISNLNRIITAPATGAIPPAKYFGNEDRNQWCYFYEKADLARQVQDWDKVIELYDQAESLGFSPGVIVEWIPLLKAYLQTNQIDRAVEIASSISASDPTEAASLCKLLARSSAEMTLSAEDKDKIATVIQLHQCGEE